MRLVTSSLTKRVSLFYTTDGTLPMAANTLGIYTRYFQHEATYAAMYAAEIAQNLSFKTTMLARDVCRREVAKYWDARVLDYRKHDFYEWSLGCSHILFTIPPSPYYIAWCSDAGIVPITMAIWDELSPKHAAAVQASEIVLFPHKCMAEAVCAEWGGPEAEFQPIEIPWDVPIPLAEPKPIPNDVTVFVPLYDSQPGRSNIKVFWIIEHMLKTTSDTKFIVASGARWSYRATRAMKTLAKRYPERVRWVKKPNPLQRLSLYSSSQVTLWVAGYEGMATIGLESLCMGVPVIAWDIPPQNEYLLHNRNSVLMPCDIRENWLGVPEAVNNWRVMRETVEDVLQNRPLLRTMRTHTQDGLKARKQVFLETWDSILH